MLKRLAMMLVSKLVLIFLFNATPQKEVLETMHKWVYKVHLRYDTVVWTYCGAL